MLPPARVRIVVGLALLLLAVGAGVAAGVGGAMIVLGAAAVCTGAWVLLTGRESWLLLATRRRALVLTLVGVAVAAIGAVPVVSPDATRGDAPSAPADTPTPTISAVPTASPSPTEAATASPTDRRASDSAADLLERLPIRGDDDAPPYARVAQFGPAWEDVDGNGCSTREDVLARDLRDVVRDGCDTLTGVLDDPYTGSAIAFVRGFDTSGDVQIDHVVSLADAWRSGAFRLDDATRLAFANDPLNLLAVDGPSNQEKSDGDASVWLPPQPFRCRFATIQVEVKTKYSLAVTPAEQQALRDSLASCPA